VADDVGNRACLPGGWPEIDWMCSAPLTMSQITGGTTGGRDRSGSVPAEPTVRARRPTWGARARRAAHRARVAGAGQRSRARHPQKRKRDRVRPDRLQEGTCWPGSISRN